MKNATLRQLRVFESAARHLSLTRAAEELHLTPPAISIQIRQLEGHATAELFERLTHHEIDLAVMSHPPADEAYIAEPFAPHPHVIVAAPDHPLAKRRAVALETVAREPIITRESGSATRL